MMTRSHRLLVPVLLFASISQVLGCSSMIPATNKNKEKDATWSFFKKKEYQIPSSINVTWTHDIYTKEGKPPTRGFGGRFYFYNDKSQAIPVEGELTVYGFDDTNKDHSNASFETADKKFKFTPEQFTTHFSESQLGASYSVWIPWDAAPGVQKKIMLIPTFKPKEGPVIRGNAATLLLPGVIPQEQEEQRILHANHGQGVQRASHVATSQNPNTDLHRRTTTIQLPPRSLQPKGTIAPEQAAALLEELDNSLKGATMPLPPLGAIPATPTATSYDLQPNQTVATSTTLPATQVASPLPSFHIPTKPMTANPANPFAVNDSGLPGFARASIAGPPTRSEPSSPQAQAPANAPSSAYLPR